MILSGKSSFYILYINPLSSYHLQIFFPNQSFHFLGGLLFCAKAFKFNYVPFVYFCCCFLYLEDRSKNYCYDSYQRVFCLFFSRAFIVSCLTFRSLIYFDFIFVYGVRKYYNFIVLHLTVHFPQHHLLRRLSLPHWMFLPPSS